MHCSLINVRIISVFSWLHNYKVHFLVKKFEYFAYFSTKCFLDLYCLQRQVIVMFSMRRVKIVQFNDFPG